MSTERSQQRERVFVEALERPPEARLAFVSAECRDDDALRADVLSLLSAADSANGFMAASAFERLAAVVGIEGWTLAAGEQVGPYGVIGRLAAGSSGEVWRARDERFGRDVALKVLLPHLSEDPARVRRFADEVRAIGALNHTNILAVHDVGNHNGLQYLVSEYLAGESLRAKIEAGPLSADDVVTIGLGIARGLEAAHRCHIVHRDLKPENVFLAEDGTVKILDFGVAKLQRAEVGAGAPGTLAGFIVGTAAYMAPEQVRGEAADPRVDLFALGVVLNEMLTGESPFKRASTVETLHAVLMAEPADIAQANPGTPDELAAIIRRLLRKDREARFQSAADLVWTLERLTGTGAARTRLQPAGTSPPAHSARWRRRPAWIATAAVAAIAGGAALWLSTGSPEQPSTPTGVTRFTWSLPPGVGLGSPPAVSPDGRAVAFVGVRNGVPHLFMRNLAELEAREIDDTAGARQPFWSPDSQWVGFFARRRVMKVSIAGGAPLIIADDSQATSVRTERGAAWGRDGIIVYGPSLNPPALFSVPASGGTPVPVTTFAPESGENVHRFPSFLPDGRHFLYHVRGPEDRRGVVLGGIDRPRLRTPVVGVDSHALYFSGPSRDQGVLLYAVNGRLTAHRFDAERQVLAGAAQPLGIDVGADTLFQPPTFGASSDVLAYAGQLPAGGQIKTVVEGTGEHRVFLDRQEQQWPRVSPDGTRMAWLLIDSHQGADIWVTDLSRGTRARITTAPERDLTHVWSPDGRQLAYRPDVEDRTRLAVIAADGSGTSRNLVCPRAQCEPTDWSSDGRELLVNAYEPGHTDVWAVAIADGGRTRPLLASRFNERDARLSPDRRWLAYVSDEAGKPEVSVRGLEESSPRRYMVSPTGGDQVVWGRDGRALYYVDPKGRLRKVAVREASGGLKFGPPLELPVTIGSGHANTQYDVAPDGRIFYLDPTPMPAPTEIRFVLGWQQLLGR
jgi:serine/threonine protein kinase/Tol biopolymer transport system component